MTATERIIEIAQKLEDLKILDFLDQCEKEGYSLREAIAELQLILRDKL